MWRIVPIVFWLVVCSALPALADYNLVTPDQVKVYSEVERIFILKTAENALTAKEKLMFDDAENANDGFLWTRKVIVGHYAMLRDFANRAGAEGLAPYYGEKSDALAGNIRGRISFAEFSEQEKQIEVRKQQYLEGVLATVPKGMKVDFKVLNELGSRLADQIHAFSMLGVKG